MGFKMRNEFGDNHQTKCQSSLLIRAVDSQEVVLLKHNRSKSDSCRVHKKLDFDSSANSSHQFNKDMTKFSSLKDNKKTPDLETEAMKQEPTKELIGEIAALELEVMYLEKYLLSLYRKAFDRQISTLPSCSSGDLSIHSWSHRSTIDNLSPLTQTQKLSNVEVNNISSASERLAENEAQILKFSHSEPISFNKGVDNLGSGLVSLADCLGTRVADHVPETPNRISEDILACISYIISKVSDPPLVNNGFSASATSSFSSESGSVSSPGYVGDTSTPHLLPSHQVHGLKEFSGPYANMVQVPSIHREKLRQIDIRDIFQNYKSLIQKLETVDPRKMKNEEKLAFWINIHNALIMHAYLLTNGVPQNSLMKATILTKVTYMIGGYAVDANIIQRFILGCRTHLPGQWLRTFILSKLKFRTRDEWKGYAIQQPEPLLHFALCSGSYSDPAVHIYRPKRIHQQLETARKDYIRATVVIRKEQKILLPKVIESFAKEKGLNTRDVIEMILKCSPESICNGIQRCRQGRSHRNKIIEWVPHNFKFRYLLSRELQNHNMFCV